MTTQVKKKLFTVDEYHTMGSAGILKEGDRVELIEGEIVEMAPIGNRHQAIVDRLNSLFGSRFGESTIVRIQGPIRLSETTEPEPDIQLLRPQDDFYFESHPSQDDALLVVEVSDSSLDYDRDEKSVLYARQGVQELWIVDLVNTQILVFRDPSDDGYRESLRLTRAGDSISPVAFPEISTTARDLLGSLIRS